MMTQPKTQKSGSRRKTCFLFLPLFFGPCFAQCISTHDFSKKTGRREYRTNRPAPTRTRTHTPPWQNIGFLLVDHYKTLIVSLKKTLTTERRRRGATPMRQTQTNTIKEGRKERKKERKTQRKKKENMISRIVFLNVV